ncbi:unnamed protein product [Adineta steineri]|uniref:Pre-mRNA-splicing factor SLU7 n=1 Tax=Adineta steineri TaxID=433720 RepID=A0A814WAJ0_9BILA|nr:unnamed protein product [Adineta steineri]
MNTLEKRSRFLDTISFEFETARSFLRRGPRHIRDVMQYSGPVDPRAIFYIIGAIVCALLFLYYVVSPSRTNEEYRLQKELEKLRKAGSTPAEVDEERKYTTDVPWYVTYDTLNEWYAHGHTDKIVTRSRLGACENCGAMTYKRKDCVKRPPRLGAYKLASTKSSR